MVRIPKTVIVITVIGVVFTSCLLALSLTVILNRPSDRVIWQSCQPDSVKYDFYNGYCLYVAEESLNWSRFPFSLRRRYYLVIGGHPSYGHYKEYSFSSELEDIETYIKKSEVEWNESGVTFKEKAGHRLFFPKTVLSGIR